MFEQDIFISYGWSGNTRHEGAVTWVQRLRNELRIALRHPLGRDPQIFLDSSLARTGILTDALDRAIEWSRLFLFVVSPGSCQSQWCPWEIHHFLEHARCVPVRNDVLLPEDRLFGVTLEQVPKDGLPASLPLVFQTYDLTKPIAGRDVAEPINWDRLADHQPAATEFGQLHGDLAARLKLIQEHEQNEVAPTGVCVFLGSASTPHHEKEFLRPIRRDLTLRGHRVLRASPAPFEREEGFRLRLGTLLGEANLSVHLLSTPLRPPEWSTTVGQWQLKRSGEQPELSRFIWEDPDLAPETREALEGLTRGDQKLDKRQTWSDLREAVLTRAGELATAKKARPGTGNKSVVIAYCDEDLAYVSAIKRQLEMKPGLRVQLAMPPRDRPGNRNRINRGLFNEANALLVYYSGRDDGQEEWLYLTCSTARDVFRKSPGHPRSAALVLHPPPPSKDNVDQIEFERLVRKRDSDFDAIDKWAAGLVEP
jgi:hypothetical protein